MALHSLLDVGITCDPLVEIEMRQIHLADCIYTVLKQSSSTLFDQYIDPKIPCVELKNDKSGPNGWEVEIVRKRFKIWSRTAHTRHGGTR